MREEERHLIRGRLQAEEMKQTPNSHVRRAVPLHGTVLVKVHVTCMTGLGFFVWANHLIMFQKFGFGGSIYSDGYRGVARTCC